MAGPQDSPAAAPVRPGDHGCSFLLVHATVATTVEWWWYGEKGPRWVRSTDNAEGHIRLSGSQPTQEGAIRQNVERRYVYGLPSPSEVWHGEFQDNVWLTCI